MTDEKLKTLISQLIETIHVEVEDQGPVHAGHREAAGGGHFRATVVSPAFRNLSPLDRHRLVYDAVKMGQNPEIHALSLTTLTPEEWQK